MTAEIAVLIGAVVLIALLAWYFFGPKAAHTATVRGGVQEVDILVKGGYSPDLVRVQAGMPVRLVFDRQDNSGCTERVVFPDLSLGRASRRSRRRPSSSRRESRGSTGGRAG